MPSLTAFDNQKGRLLLEALLGILLLGLFVYFFDQLIFQIRAEKLQKKNENYINQIKTVFNVIEKSADPSSLILDEQLSSFKCNKSKNEPLDLFLIKCDFSLTSPSGRDANWSFIQIGNNP